MILPGHKVKDKVSGIVGIVENRIESAYSGPRLGIQPPVKADGTLPDPIYIDEVQAELFEVKRIIEIDVPKPKFAFGQKIKDTVTGFVGTITLRAVYINGCRKYFAEGPALKGKQSLCEWFSEERIIPVGKKLRLPKEDKHTRAGPTPPAFRSFQ